VNIVIRAVTIFALSALASVAFVSPASAANLYKPGTTPDLMFKVVEPVVGDAVTPVFIMGDEPLKFMSDVDSEAVKAAGVKEETMRYYLTNLKPESKAFNVVGYAMGGSVVPGNEVKNRTCAIVISSAQQMKTTSTMFHESIHCKNFAALRDDAEAWRLASSLNDPALGMADGQFMSLFQEVLAAYMQVAYHSNLGLKHGMGMVMRAAQEDHNIATSIGYRTARRALSLCAKKDACPTDPVALVKMLAGDPVLKAELTQDIHELFLAAQATGYIVQDH
jgi:hypothetical protein